MYEKIWPVLGPRASGASGAGLAVLSVKEEEAGYGRDPSLRSRLSRRMADVKGVELEFVIHGLAFQGILLLL